MTRHATIAGTILAVVIAAGCAGSPPPSPSPSPTPRPTASPSPASDVCNGPDTVAEWSRVPQIVRRYGDAWMADSDEARLAALDEVWADAGVYVDSFMDAPVVGRQALAEHMAFGFGLDQYIEISGWTAADMHNDRVRIRWRDCCPTGVLLLTGADFGEIDADGRFSRLTSFWDHFVEEVAAEACD